MSIVVGARLPKSLEKRASFYLSRGCAQARHLPFFYIKGRRSRHSDAIHEVVKRFFSFFLVCSLAYEVVVREIYGVLRCRGGRRSYFSECAAPPTELRFDGRSAVIWKMELCFVLFLFNISNKYNLKTLLSTSKLICKAKLHVM